MISNKNKFIVNRRNFLSGGIAGVAGLLAPHMTSGNPHKVSSRANRLNDLLPNAPSKAGEIIQSISSYLVKNQDMKAGEYYGSIWSEKAYHGPLLDYHAGGAHHHRGAGSAGLAMFEDGLHRKDNDLLRRAEHCFDWLSVRQHARGGYFEIQNNEKPSDWEGTGEDECSTISTAFAVNGLGFALLKGLPPKKQYMDCLRRAGMWQLGLELIPNSGVFPHHERSPWDTLNANMHAAETMALAFYVLKEVYNQRINILQFGAERAIKHTLTKQWENGCFPYRASGRYNGATINYTSVVLWCLFNVKKIMPDIIPAEADAKVEKAREFLVSSFEKGKGLLWEKNEFTTAKYNIWTYAITANVLRGSDKKKHVDTANDIVDFLYARRASNGLLPMRDRGEEITECAFMQADIMLFLSDFV